MKIEPFQLERWLNSIESCEIDAAQGSGLPIQLKEITTNINFKQYMTYGVTTGSKLLRQEIADWYSKINLENVLVTSGTSEANLLSNLYLLEPGDEYVVMYPLYKQTIGFVQSLGCTVKTCYLREEREWHPDLALLNEVVTKKTKIIFFDNPNNPTGAILNNKEMQAICEIAEDVDAYVICDNAVRGSELHGESPATPFDYYEKGVITGSVSKLGMIGLRIGWIIGNRNLIRACLTFKDYTTLSHSGISEYLATIALQKENLSRYIKRNIDLNKTNLERFNSWMNENPDLLSWIPPKAGYTAFPKYFSSLESEEFCKRFLREEQTLLSPGSYFGVDQHVRINIGIREDVMTKLLNRLTRFLNQIK